MKTESDLKFDKQGKPRPYYGNTIISFVNDEALPVYKQVCLAQKKLKRTSFADCLAFLPPSSFHITILTLCREIDRNTKYWPDWIEETKPFKQVDHQLAVRIAEIPVPKNVRMEIEECKLTKVLVKPYTEDDEEKLWGYRDAVSATVGIRHPGYESFRFHISLDYQVNELKPEQEAEKNRVCSEITQELRARTEPFLLTAPQFVVFNDMMSYYPQLSKRGAYC